MKMRSTWKDGFCKLIFIISVDGKHMSNEVGLILPLVSHMDGRMDGLYQGDLL